MINDFSTHILAEPVPVAEPPRENGTTRPSKWDATINRLAAHPGQWFIIAETRAASSALHYLPSIAARRGVTLEITERVGGPKGDRTTRVYARMTTLIADAWVASDLESAVDRLPVEVTHCVHGHEFTPENTYTRPDGRGRACRACNATRSQTWRQSAGAGQ